MVENDTRSKLIEVATQLFATKGYAAVSIRELTVAAQVNVSAISYYFNGKEGLYQAVLEDQLAPILGALQAAKKKGPLSSTERLAFYADQVAAIHLQRPFISRFIQMEIINPTHFGGPVIEKHLAQAYLFVNTVLQEGIANSEFRPELDSSYATIALIGILNFYFISQPLLPRLLSEPKPAHSERQYITHAFQVYLHGIMNVSV